MDPYRLYCFAQSGYSYSVALMLELTGAKWEPVFVDFFNGANRTAEYEALNAMSEAPVLEGPDGRLTQSGVILRYLARKSNMFGGRNEAEDDEILRWILWNNHRLSGYLAPYRFFLNFLPEEKRDPGVVAFLNGRRRIACKILEKRLTEQEWVATADRATIADISCCGYLFWLDEIGETRADWPAIGRWLDRIKALPGWRAAYDLMPGHPLPARGGA